MSVPSRIHTLLVCLILMPSWLFGQGLIKGIVSDASSDDRLIGVNVIIMGTSLGTATDIEGRFQLQGLPERKVSVKFSCVGYESHVQEVDLAAMKTRQLTVRLKATVLEGEVVVITAQLRGQLAAINRQLSANSIVNVVSAEKIKELPDRNAAEALSRLPGISLQRDAGEGQKIVVRGLAPKFNAVTVNGERIPSTDVNDRSVDLSMISPDMLAGIEVFKSLTPDKDADAIGGSVNFVVQKAPSELHGGVRAEGGYNRHADDRGNYKTSVRVSDRFYDDVLGVAIGGNIERANRSSHESEVEYRFKEEQQTGKATIEVTDLNLADRIEVRKRLGANLTMDYSLPNGEVMLNSFWSRTDRDEVRRRKRFRVSAFRTEYALRKRETTIDLWTMSLSGKNDFDVFQTSWQLSTSRSNQVVPYSHTARFEELAAFSSTLRLDQGPSVIPRGAYLNLNDTFFKESALDTEDIKDRDYTAHADVKAPFRLGEDVSGYVKAGLKHREKSRSRDNTRFWTSAFNINYLGQGDITGRWQLTPDKRIKLANFIDPSFSPKNFLNGQYDFGPGLSLDALERFAREFRQASLTGQHAGDPVYVLDNLIDLDDYSASEAITAGFIMSEINLGQWLTFIPGVRYERTFSDYRSVFGTPVQYDDETQGIDRVSDSTGNRTVDGFFPMFQLKIKPAYWFDIRAAVTRTLSRPDYINLVPWERIRPNDRTVERGNPDSRHTISWNRDLFVSFYGEFGLVTIGGFYKSIRDIEYLRVSRIMSGALNGYTLTSPVNADGTSIVKGLEFEFQTSLKFLPSPFDGVVLSANYSKISSSTVYPFFEIDPRSPLPPFQPVIIDTVRTGPMPRQADDIANVSLGYEKAGFSGRISLVYQGRSLAIVGQRAELDGYTDASTRWDITMKQTIWSGLSLSLSINNLTNIADASYLGDKAFPTAEEYFDWTADIGVQFSF